MFSLSQSSTASSQVPKPNYPLYANLDGCRVVVVGAGAVALRKIATLLDCGADVTVIAPSACNEVLRLAAGGCISYLAREYERDDLDGALLAIAATSSREVNEAVSADAQAKPILVNVVDVPELCSFIVPSALRRGMFQIAVTTGGAAPGIARSVRQELEDAYPPWWEDYIAFLAMERALVKARVPEAPAKRERLYEALGAEWLRGAFACGEEPDLETVYERIINSFPEGEEE